MDKKIFKQKLFHNLERSWSVLKWTVLSIFTGVSVGLFSTAFGLGMKKVTSIRSTFPWFIYFLPIGAVLITAIYRLILKEKDGGTNVVLSAIHSGDRLPLRMAPLIFISTLLSHLVGASAGREGAALQMGGAIGNGIGRALKMNTQDKNTIIMCGMSAAFSALFGTPLAAAIFSMEVISVGIMHYAALVPCVVSALIARGIAASFGLNAEGYLIDVIPSFTIANGIKASLLAILCGLISMVFCILLHFTSYQMNRYLKNPYVKAFIGGTTVMLLTLIIGNQTYNGAGSDIIESCFKAGCTVTFSAFILKMIFTAISLSSGYKGGEIVPTLFIGATFGFAFGTLIGFSPALCAAIGMGALFCGVTNCPVSSLLICLELFGMQGAPYFLIGIAFSYFVSGYYSLYHSQKIVYSKYKSNYINKSAK